MNDLDELLAEGLATTKAKCSISSCEKFAWAKGLCGTHIARLRDGSAMEPPIKKVNAAGKARSLSGGYVCVSDKKTEHVIIAEKALGRKLPKGVIVHHADENRSNNSPSNLVICPDQTYHLLLHKRQNALKACGHADWVKCQFCGEYSPADSPDINKGKYPGRHKACMNAWYHQHKKVSKISGDDLLEEIL